MRGNFVANTGKHGTGVGLLLSSMFPVDDNPKVYDRAQGQRAEIVYKHLRHTVIGIRLCIDRLLTEQSFLQFDGSASGMWYELAARSADAV